MFDISSKNIDLWKHNFYKWKHILLEKDLDCFILISSNDWNFLDLLFNNILDFIIDKITINNPYQEFSIALENINWFINTWRRDLKKWFKLDIFIWILHKNNFLFSNLWEASCYLIKNDKEILELTSKIDPKEDKKEFTYISNWELKHNEIILMSNIRILDILTESDLIDWITEDKSLEFFNKNIIDILRQEILKENIIISSINFKDKNHIEENETSINIKEKYLEKIKKTHTYEKVWNKIEDLKWRIKKSSKSIKNIIFILWITVSLFFIYSILSWIIWATTESNKKTTALEKLEEAKGYIRLASDNIQNEDLFEINLKNAEKIVAETKKQKILLDSIDKITEDINILKKQFNKIETFDDSNSELIYKWDLTKAVKILKVNNRIYIIEKKWVLWPILPNSEPKYYSFDLLENNEEFVDVTEIWERIIILTNLSKIVTFTTNWHFAYSDAIWQQIWEKSKELKSYWQNIYLLWNDNQIIKHSVSWTNFTQAKTYLKPEDLSQIWQILSIAIDWWIYILKKDLTIIKFFSTPKYRLEKIVLNKLPKNYTLEQNTKIKLEARNNLNYVYLLMNNKIYVFKTNTKNYNDTKSLTYVWQVEWNNTTIKDFLINYDWEINILNKDWIYKVNFEVSNDKLLIR